MTTLAALFRRLALRFAAQKNANPARRVVRRDTRVGAWVPLMLWDSLKTPDSRK